MIRRLAAASAATLALLSTSSIAAEIFWTGAVDGTWSNPGNWDLARAPMTGDHVRLANVGAAPNTYDLVGVNLRRITISTVATIGGGPIVMQGGGLINDGTGGQVINAPVQLNGPSTISGDTVYNGVISGTGPLTITPSAELHLNAVNTYSGATIHNGATFTSLVADVDGAIPAGSALTIAGAGRMGFEQSSSIGSLAGNNGNGIVIVRVGKTLTVGGDNTSTTFPGQISQLGGPASLVKAGTGTFTLSGASTHTGTTTVAAGRMNVTGSIQSPTVVNSGAVLGGTGTINSDVTVNTGGTLSPGPSAGILSTGNLSLNAGGTLQLELNGATPGTFYDQVNVAGTVSLGGATLSVVPGGPLAPGSVFTIINNDGADAAIGTFAGLPQGAVFAAGGYAFLINYAGGDGNDVTLTALSTNAEITWTGAVDGTWSNPGNWDLARAPMTGDHVRLANVGAAPNTYDLVGVNLRRITISTVATIGGGPIVMQGGGLINDGTGGQVINAPVQLNGPSTISGDTVYNGVISGTGPLTITPSAELHLNAVNTYSGATIHNGATFTSLVADVDGAIPAGSALTIAGAGRMGFEQSSSIGSLAGNNGNGIVIVRVGKTLTVGGDNTSTTFPGQISQLGGPASLVKAGTGTFTLSGASTHTGTTTVAAGRMNVTGSIQSPTVVNSGAVLGGTGTINSDVTVNTGGTLSPGLSAGILSTGNLSLNAGGTLQLEINGATPGTLYDQVNVAGTVSLGGATLAVVAGGFIASGSVFTIINNDGADAVVGTFNGLAQGAVVTLGGHEFQVSYVGGDGNDVTLATAVASDTITWTGAVNGAWSNPANWDLGRAPITGDAVRLANAGVAPDTYDLAGVALRSIHIAKVVTLGGNTVVLQSGASITDGNGLGVINAPVQLNGPSTMFGGTVYNGVISGTGPLTINPGVGGLHLNAVNTYSGATIHDGLAFSILKANVNGAVPAGSALTVVAGNLELIQTSTVGSLAGAGKVIVSAGQTLTVGGDNSSTTFSGQISQLGGPASLVKAGTGTFTLSGASTFTGTTTVGAGRLDVTGSIQSPTVVNSGAVLGGTGAVIGGVTVNPGGKIAPGVAP